MSYLGSLLYGHIFRKISLMFPRELRLVCPCTIYMLELLLHQPSLAKEWMIVSASRDMLASTFPSCVPSIYFSILTAVPKSFIFRTGRADVLVLFLRGNAFSTPPSITMMLTLSFIMLGYDPTPIFQVLG